jgi:hypothetical protein
MIQQKILNYLIHNASLNNSHLATRRCDYPRITLINTNGHEFIIDIRENSWNSWTHYFTVLDIPNSASYPLCDGYFPIEVAAG